LIWIIHHLLGANCDKNPIFKCDSLVDESFEMAFDLAGQQISATRSGNNAGQVIVDSNLAD